MTTKPLGLPLELAFTYTGQRTPHFVTFVRRSHDEPLGVRLSSLNRFLVLSQEFSEPARIVPSQQDGRESDGVNNMSCHLVAGEGCQHAIFAPQ
jgi:hypothetical protein